jgi:dienelactone hydrolase
MKKISLIGILVVFLVTQMWTKSFMTGSKEISFSAKINGKSYNLEAMLYYPLNSKKEFPLIVMNHGRNGQNPKRNENQIFGYKNLNELLASKGYLVMNLVRRGYGKSDGPDSEFLETPEESGLAGAQDIKAAIEFMQTRKDVIKDKIVIIGQSQGGWVALAASTIEINGVLGAINISGAINFKKAGNNSIRSSMVEDQLENSAKIFGESSKIPTLWIYAENDNHLPDSVKKWFNAYYVNGGKGKLAIKPAYKDKGHSIINEPDLFINDIIDFFNEIGFKI